MYIKLLKGLKIAKQRENIISNDPLINSQYNCRLPRVG